MPQPINYTPHSSNSMAYTFKTHTDAYYDDSSPVYSAAPSVESKIAADESSEMVPIKINQPTQELLMQENHNPLNHISNIPIENLIQEFMPQMSIPTEIMPINEIEHAIDKIVKIEHFEMQEEIIIRRKIVRKSVVFGH